MNFLSRSLDVRALATDYASGAVIAAELFLGLSARAAQLHDPAIWIDRLSWNEIEAQLHRAQQRRDEGIKQPLFGVPFAVKDNIDVAGRKTTAACPDFAYAADRSAPVVQRLCDAGAILVGKTNLDQFATGLVGVRSPYGACRNVFNSRYISGGSSSGSAVAVALGLVSFALGTDTAGSGRVPAAFNNIVGLKPSRGLLSTSGVVPASRSIDCVSIFALNCNNARTVAHIAAAFDPADVYSRHSADFPAKPNAGSGTGFRFGVPSESSLRFFGSADGPSLFRQGIERLCRLGGQQVEIEFAPFAEAGNLLYDGPWIAERLAGIREFFERSPQLILPITRSIIEKGKQFSAVQAFDAEHRLRQLMRLADAQWKKMDVMVTPTAGRVYTLAEVESEPTELNKNLGYYTNFVNLMDLCAIAVPSGIGADGMPFGISIIGHAGSDEQILTIGERFHQSTDLKMGATGFELPSASTGQKAETAATAAPRILLAVVGAHLSGQPLNHQLIDLGAQYVRTTRTSPHYRLYALQGTIPPKPGLVNIGDSAPPLSHGIEVEVWELGVESFGAFIAAIPAPLGIGTIELDDGTLVKGFLFESYAAAHSRDISAMGSWRNYLANLAGAAT